MKKLILFTLSIFCFISHKSQNLQWVKKIDTQASTAMFNSTVKIDSQNNIIVSGLLSETIDFDLGPGTFTMAPTPSSSDIFMAKYTASGNFLWAKKIACPNNYMVYGDFTIDTQNNIILSALVYDVVDVNPSAAINNIGTMGISTTFMAKYDVSGNFLWVDTFSGNMIISKIKTDSQNKIIAAGKMYNTVDFDPQTAVVSYTAAGNSNLLFIAQYSSLGNYSWVKTMGSATNFNEDIYDLYLDSTNTIFIAGRYNGIFDFDPSSAVTNLNSQNKYVGFFAKYTSNGSFGFARSFNCTGNSQVRNVSTDKIGNIVLSGKFIGTMDLDASAGVKNVSASSSTNLFLTQYNSQGNINWGFSIGNTSEELLTNHDISPNGNIYIFGRFKGTVNFNPLGTANNLSSLPSSKTDLFIASYTNAGTLKNINKLGGNKAETPNYITLNKTANELILFGSMESTVDFDFTSAVSSLTATGQDYFIAKYNYTANSFKQLTKEDSSVDSDSSNNVINNFEITNLVNQTKKINVTVFPNPAVDKIIISSSEMINSLQLINANGVVTKSTQDFYLNNSSAEINVNDLLAGIYVIILNGKQSKTIIKQ